MTDSPRVLLIDDDPTQIAILTAYLNSRNVLDVVGAQDGLDAKKVIEETSQPFDRIFTDLSMPNVDGFEFLKYLASRKFPGSVIIISGHENMLLESARSLGKMYGLNISGQIRKPLTKQALDRLFAEEKTTAGADTQMSGHSIPREQLVAAINHGEIVPFYQPKIDLLSGRVIGAEALARWVTESRGTVSPAQFLPLAEQHGLMTELTMSIIDSVLADYHGNADSWSGKKISVNLTPELLRDTNLPDILENMVKAAGLTPELFCMEIIESSIMNLEPDVIEVLARMRIKGFDVSIDDFGTGGASIANLKMFPYNELKIDQSFIHNVLTDAVSAETVRTSISLARQLELRIVAEGIETQDVLRFVKSKGIEEAQGYLFSKPIRTNELSEFFAEPLSWISRQKQQPAA